MSSNLSSQLYDHNHLLDHFSTAIVLLDHQLHITSLNLAAESLFLLSLQQVQGSNLTSLLKLSSDLIWQLQQSLNNSQPFTSRESHIKLLTGESMIIDFTATPIEEEQYLILEIRPLDRIKHLSQDQRMHSRRQYSANLVRNLAHEIKNPLSGVHGAAQLLEREVASQISDQYKCEVLQEYVHVIISEANRLRDLVDRLLGPQRQTQKQLTNIHRVLNNTHRLLVAEAGDSIHLQQDYDPSLPELMLDANQLMQVFLNIGRNALQALQENPVEDPSITLKTRVMHRFTIGSECHQLVCCVSICDNGPGIKSELKDDIFFPMVTHRAQGTGLGLSIAQDLVFQHQGCIGCDSIPGHTCFNVCLPMETLQ